MKKAQIEILVTIILLLLVSALVFTFWKGAEKGIDETVAIQQCQASFLAAQGASEASFGFVARSVNCPAPHHIFAGGENFDEVKRLTKDMKNCWDKTGGNNNRIGLVTLGNICTVCSTFEVKKEAPVSKVVAELDRKIPGSKKKFYEAYLDSPVLVDRGNFDFLFKKPLTDNYIHLGPDQRDQEYISFDQDKKYYVVAMNYGDTRVAWGSEESEEDDYDYGEFNHLFIIAEEDSHNLECLLLYQPT